MNPNWLAGGCALLALLGQVINLLLNLRLRNAMLEMRKEILTDVAREYKRADVCSAEMARLEPPAVPGRRVHA